jgi:hypothetical protein
MLLQIGDMTVSFGHLEFWMRNLFVYLVNQSSIIGQILGSYLRFSDLSAAISTLYEERFGGDELLSELKELLKEAAGIEQERNAITHSFWLAGQTSETITRHKVTARSRSGFRLQMEQYREEDLLKFNESIKELTGKFLEFHNKLPNKIPELSI